MYSPLSGGWRALQTMTLIMKKISILLLLILSISLFSCKILKNNTISKNTKNQTAATLLDSLQNNNLKYETLTIKYTAKYSEEDKNFSFSGTINIIKDSCILMTFSPGFGIELGRLLLTTDSVKVSSFFSPFRR